MNYHPSYAPTLNHTYGPSFCLLISIQGLEEKKLVNVWSLNPLACSETVLHESSRMLNPDA